MKIKNGKISYRWIINYFINCLRRFGLIYMLHEMYYKFFTYVLEKFFRERCNKDTLRYLRKYRKKSSDYSSYYKPVKDLEPCVWTCWLQGYNNAPAIVKACINSIYKNTNGKGYNVIIITEENMSDYICMPDFILDKYKRGIISKAHFSDLLRTLLLINYGGVWVDATVLLTREVPQIILDSDFFVFKAPNFSGICPCSNWFIVAKKESPLLIKVFEILAEYWKDNKYLINYFMYHVCIRLIITYDEDAKQIWKNMLPKNNADPMIFTWEKLFDTMDVRMKNYLWDLSFAYKLTYRFDDVFGDDSLLDKKGTFYQYIISENLSRKL